MIHTSSYKNIDPIKFYESELGIPIIKVGIWILAGLCPFHEDRSAGSFFVNCKTGSYKCFSCDAKGGDVIQFTRDMHSLSYFDAVNYLERRF